MLVSVLQTFVEATPKGMIVGNAGAELDLDAELAAKLKSAGKVWFGEDADFAGIAAQIVGPDGAPINPPAGDLAADIASPATVAAPKPADARPPARSKTGGRPPRAKAVAAPKLADAPSPVDAPI